MAETTEQNYDELITEKNSQTALNGLQPAVDDSQKLLQDLSEPDAVEDWRLWLWLVAFTQTTLQKMFAFFKADVATIMANQQYGTTPWLIQEGLKFQLGHELLQNGAGFSYAVSDEATQIVKKCAVNSQSGILQFKVLKDNNEILLPVEKTAYEVYVDLIAPPGINTSVISAQQDVVRANYKVYYNPLVMLPTGALISNPAVFPVQDAINNYVASIIFNGKFETTKLTDAIQQAIGVVNPVEELVEYKYGTLQYAPMPDFRIAFSGHYRFEAADSIITYIPHV